jgi:putative transposase
VKTLGGLDTEASRLRSLEDENCRLKKLLAETMLDNSMLKDNATE